MGALWWGELLQEVKCGRILVKAGKSGKSKELLKCLFWFIFLY